VNLASITRVTRVRAVDGVVVRQVDDCCVIVSLKTGNCWELNRVGSEIWRLFEQGLSGPAVCAEMTARYQISLDTATEDVRDLLQALTREGLINMTIEDPSASQP
jgi:hypothetical protein